MKITNMQNLMVSIGLKASNSGDLMNVGFNRVFRTKEQQTALTALYAAKAKETTPSLDVNRLSRTDAAGNSHVDGGYLLFTKEGQKMVTPKYLTADLTKNGFRLTVVEIFQSEGDEEHLKLRLTWSRNSTVKVTLDHRQKMVLRKYFNMEYWKLFGFYNLQSVSLEGNNSPIKGSIVTLNFSGFMNAGQVQHKDDIREVRMTDSDGHLACPIIQSPAVTPVTAPYRCPERTPARFTASLGEIFDQGLGAK